MNGGTGPILVGAGLAAAVLMIIVGLIPAEPRPARPVTRWRGLRQTVTPAGRGGRLLVAAIVAVAVLAATRWPVAAAGAAAAAWLAPAFFGEVRRNRAAIDRAGAIEEWTRRVADNLTARAGLEAALMASTKVSPPLIRAEVAALADRLRAQWPTERALRGFADDLGDATGDLVVAALILGSRQPGEGLSDTLRALAAAVGEEVAMRREIEAERATPRQEARIVITVAVGGAALFSLNREYMAPYGTPAGQVVMALVIGGFALVIWWMQRSTRMRPEPRFLTGDLTGGRRS